MIGFFDYVVTVITPSQILRNMNSEKFKGFDALDNNSACRDGVPSATIIIKKVNHHGFTFGWIKAHVVTTTIMLASFSASQHNINLWCNFRQLPWTNFRSAVNIIPSQTLSNNRDFESSFEEIFGELIFS